MVPPSLSRGALRVLACPAALCPHVEFAVAEVLSQPVSLSWTAQTARPPMLRAGTRWHAAPGAAGRLAAALRRIGPVCFDVEEGACPGFDAERFSFVPELGMARVTLAAHGDVVLGEEQLRALLCGATSVADARHRLDRALRRAGDGQPVGVLRHTG